MIKFVEYRLKYIIGELEILQKKNKRFLNNPKKNYMPCISIAYGVPKGFDYYTQNMCLYCANLKHGLFFNKKKKANFLINLRVS